MKATFLSLLLFITCYAMGQQYYYVTAPQLNIRSGAGTNYATVGRLIKGDSVLLLSTTDNWVKLKVNDTSDGYVSTIYLTTTRPDSVNKTENVNQTTHPDSTNKGINSLWYKILFGILVAVGLIFGKSSNKKSTSSSSNRQSSFSKSIENKSPQIFWWQCKYCGSQTLPVKQSKTPSAFNCPSGKQFHQWNKLAEVGDINYQCRYCGTQINAKSTPSAFNCPSGKQFHQWNKL